jgi:hypothetical protein
MGYSQEKSAEQFIAEAIAWLEEKWGGRACPYCGASDWAIGEPVQLLAAFVRYQKGTLSPAFTVMCTNCGHTSLINALVAGLVAEPEDEANP